LRESRSVADKHARVRASLPMAEADRFRQLLAALVTQDSTDIVI
jgi:hypothetical protein